MSKGKIALLIVVGILGFIVLSLGGCALSVKADYTEFFQGKQGCDNQWAKVESKEQRRFDLLPNLATCVRQGGLQQEKDIYKMITDARKAYAGAPDTASKVQAATQFEGALSRLLVVMEQNPDRRTDALVKSLMEEVAGSENRISTERDRYNDKVTDYNNIFSDPIKAYWGHMFGFKEYQYFKASEGAKTVPQIDLNTSK